MQAKYIQSMLVHAAHVYFAPIHHTARQVVGTNMVLLEHLFSHYETFHFISIVLVLYRSCFNYLWLGISDEGLHELYIFMSHLYYILNVMH